MIVRRPVKPSPNFTAIKMTERYYCWTDPLLHSSYKNLFYLL